MGGIQGKGLKQDIAIITTKPFKVKIFNFVYIDVNLYICRGSDEIKLCSGTKIMVGIFCPRTEKSGKIVSIKMNQTNRCETVNTYR